MQTEGIGQPFSPYRLFEGAFIPECIMRYAGISPAAKLCWARLARFCGKFRECWPRLSVLAEELAVSERSVFSYLRELETDGFILIVQQGLQKPNKYLILRHKVLHEALMGQSPERPADSDGVSDHGTLPVAVPDPQTIASPDPQTVASQESQTIASPTYSTEESQENRVNDRYVSFSEFCFRWNREPKLKKPNKATRNLGELRWKAQITNLDLDDALFGFRESEWAKHEGFPFLGFVKDPHSWILRKDGDAWESDADYCEFISLYVGTEAPNTDDDNRKAWATWKEIDADGRLLAKKHIQTCEGAHVKLIHNYLATKEYTRKPRPEPKSKSESIMEQV